MVALSFLQTVELVKHARLTKVPGSGDAMRREWYNILIKRQGSPLLGQRMKPATISIL